MASASEQMKNDNAMESFKRRSLDIAEEPLRMLLPIDGYEELPLVSLKEALKPLLTILPKAERYAWIAEQNCQDPADGLEQNESAAIMLYSMDWEPKEQCLYVVLNSTLRDKKRTEHILKPWLLYLKLILTGLTKLPSNRQCLFRGVKLDLSKQYSIGKTFVWWGFSSCTTHVSVIEQFLGNEDDRTMFTIDCYSGKNVQNHSFFETENEVLLLPACYFEVVSSLKLGANFHIIQLKEIQPPVPLLPTFASPPVSLLPTFTSPPVPLLSTSASPPVPLLSTLASPPIPLLSTLASPPVPFLSTLASPLVPLLSTSVSPHVPLLSTPANPPVPLPSTSVSPPVPLLSTLASPSVPLLSTLASPPVPLLSTLASPPDPFLSTLASPPVPLLSTSVSPHVPLLSTPANPPVPLPSTFTSPPVPLLSTLASPPVPLLSTLASPPVTIVLDFSKHSITDDDVQVLTQQALVEQKFTQLKLNQNHITDVGVKYLGNTLRNNTVSQISLYNAPFKVYFLL
jgi:hypothetical protein